MKINSEANVPFTTQRKQSQTAGNADAISAAIAPVASTAPTSEVKRADFSNMTRQELLDWVNNQIRSGEMTVHLSSPFISVMVKISAETGQSVDMATDTTRMNFIETARRGIEGAESRHDSDAAARLQSMLEIMLRNQGEAIGVDVRT